MTSVVEIGAGGAAVNHTQCRFPVSGAVSEMPAVTAAIAGDASAQSVRQNPCVSRLTIQNKKERMALGEEQNKKAVSVVLQSYYQLDEEWRLPEVLQGRAVYALFLPMGYVIVHPPVVLQLGRSTVPLTPGTTPAGRDFWYTALPQNASHGFKVTTTFELNASMVRTLQQDPSRKQGWVQFLFSLHPSPIDPKEPDIGDVLHKVRHRAEWAWEARSS